MLFIVLLYSIHVISLFIVYRLTKGIMKKNELLSAVREFVPVCAFIPIAQTILLTLIIVECIDYKTKIIERVSNLIYNIFGD